MIRICVAAAAALLIAGCSKAPEDVTARYTLAGGQGTVTVKAAGNGNARIDSNSQTLIRRDGTEYLVGSDSQGSFAASVPDFIAVMADMLKETGMKPPALPPQPEYDLTKAGKETVGGIEGDIWKVAAKDKKAAPAEAAEAVISADPSLANVGKAMQMQTRLGVASMEQIQGGRTSLDKRVEEMLGKGMVLRFGPAIKLDKIERGPVDASSFELPKPVLDKDALKKRLMAEREKMRAMQQQRGPMPAPGAPGAPGAAPQAPAPAPAPKQ